MNNPEAAAYFDGAPRAMACFEKLGDAILKRHPEARVAVQKSTVAFRDPRPFCYVSLPYRCKTGEPKYVSVSFGLDVSIPDSRIAHVSEPYPNRWTHHVHVSGPEEVDEQLLAWIEWAWQFRRKLTGGEAASERRG